jgi:hypothetical protein
VFWTKRQNGRYASLPTARKPLARAEDLIIQDVEGEVLVYDELNARAHCLSVDAGRVWRACDGNKGPDALAAELFMPADTVMRALAELEEKELLDAGPELSLNGHGHDHGNGATRREFGFKAAKVGAAVAAGPMIYSIVAPTALATVTTPEIVCNFYSGSSCDACQHICGCCCCCQGCSSQTQPACKMCSAISTCPTHTDGCLDELNILMPNQTNTKCTSGPNCSATAKPGKCMPGCVPCTTDPSGFCTNNAPDACGQHDCNCFGQGNPCAQI